MKTVSAIIVNYNTKDILRDCLRNLYSNGETSQVIVIDNSSSDGSAGMVKDEFLKGDYPNLVLLESPNNGLAVGNNLGIDKSEGDYLLFMGSDAFPEKGAVENLVKYMELNSAVGISTGKLVLTDGSLDVDAHRGFPTPWAALTHFSKLNKLFPKSKLFNKYFMGYEDFDKPHDIDLCISHFMMVKREVIKKIGVFDKDFFLYGEDVDFCWRAKQAGYRIMYLPMSKVIHYKGASVGIRKSSQGISNVSNETKLKMHKVSTEAMKKFYKKHWMHKYPKILTLSIFLAINAMTVFRTVGFKLSVWKNSAFKKK